MIKTATTYSSTYHMPGTMIQPVHLTESSPYYSVITPTHR